jgi:hypothetical protein
MSSYKPHLPNHDPMTTLEDEGTSTLSSMYSNIVEALTLVITPSRFEILFDCLSSKIGDMLMTCKNMNEKC